MHDKLEVAMLPVTDMDRATELHEKTRFQLDLDHRRAVTVGVAPLTPPSSGEAISFGTGRTKAAPGSAKGIHLIVDGGHAGAWR